MRLAAAATPPEEATGAPPPESPWRRFAAEFAQSRLALVGLALLAGIDVERGRKAALLG